MNKVAELAKKLAEQAMTSGIVKVGFVVLQDESGDIHKTEFGFLKNDESTGTADSPEIFVDTLKS